MELIDPNTQDFQYLALSQFNGEKKYVRARCQMLKDEPFIQDTSNAFVAVESFRLSCSPNEGGIVYRMLPNTYAIQCERDVPGGDPNDATAQVHDVNGCFPSNFYLDGELVVGKKVCSFVPDMPTIETPWP